MPPEGTGEDTRRERLDAALREWFAAQASGEALDRTAWLERHGELASDLASALDDPLGSLAARAAATAPTAVVAAGASGETGSSGETVVDDAGAVPESATLSRAPRTVGEHRILGEIARGGMGVVYRARHERLGRDVALKMLSSGFASEEEVERFEVEAKAAASLEHPGIVPVYGFGEHEGRPWLSMKLVQGGSLRERLPRLRREPRKLALLLAQVARAMHHAHKRGILHRDLKPANILLDESGAPLVTDFGLAKRVESDERLTRSGAVVGTPSYMPPEQARGERGLTTAVDVWALGAILYEGLTGRPPYLGATPIAIVLAVVREDLVPPSRIARGIDRDLETICLRCLEREPERRYGSAEALAEELERWERGEPILARRISAPARLLRWAKRRPSAALLAVASANAVVLAIFGLAASNSRLEEERQKTSKALDELAKSAGETKAALDREQRFSYMTRLALAKAKLGEGDDDGAAAVLDSCSNALRGIEWHLLDRRARGEIARLPVCSSGTGAAFSPDSRHMALVRPGGKEVAILELESGKTVLSFAAVESPSSATVYSLAWSADGERLALGSADLTISAEHPETKSPPYGIALHGLARGKAELLWRKTGEADACPQGLAFSPDGKRLAALLWRMSYSDVKRENRTDSYATVILSAEDGKSERELDTIASRETFFADDGRTLASGGKVWDTETWTETLAGSLASQLGPVGSMSGDGKRFAFLPPRSGRFQVVDYARPFNENTVCDGHRKAIESVALSRSGELVASAAERDNGPGETKLWDAWTGDLLLDLGGPSRRVELSPDGKLLAAIGRGGLRIFEVETVGEPRKIGENAPRFRRTFPARRTPEGLVLEGFEVAGDATWSPDGRWILAKGLVGERAPGEGIVETRHEELRLLDARTGRRVLTVLDPEPLERWSAAFSPDGSLLAVVLGRDVAIFDTSSRERRRTIPSVGERIWCVAFSRSGRFLACHAKEGIRVFRAADGSPVAAPEGWGFGEDAKRDAIPLPGQPREGLSDLASLAARPASLPVLLAWPDGEGVRIEPTGVLDGLTARRIEAGERVLGVALSLDAKLVAVETASRIRVFGTAKGDERPAPDGLEPFAGAEFGPNAQRLALAHQDAELRSSDRITAFGGDLRGARCGLSPGGRLVLDLYASGATLAVRDAFAGLPVVARLGNEKMACAAWSQDGKRIAAGGHDGVVRLFDAESGTELLSLRAHTHGLGAIELSPDGTRLLTLGYDGTMNVLDGFPRPSLFPESRSAGR